MRALRRVSSSSRAALERACDRKCRRLVVILRDRSECQRCERSTANGYQVHWCHVVTRNAKSIRHSPFNILTLCARCHKWFDANKGLHSDPAAVYRSEAWLWFEEKFPPRAESIRFWRTSKPAPVSYKLVLLWLEQQLAAGGYHE